MKNIIHYWQMIHGILFLFQRDENLLDANGFIEPSMDQMEKVDEHKSHLVDKGFSQIEGIDYIKTFSPVAKMNSICLVLSLVASFKWEVHQMDVKSPFLHGDWHEEIYMEQPLGFIQRDSSLVCRLKKSLYGLK